MGTVRKEEAGGPIATPACAPPFSPARARASRLNTSAGELLVFSYPVGRFRVPETLSRAEASVALATIHGRSLAEIARERGTATRTVANQLRAVYGKLGARTRFDLARILWTP